MPARGASAPSAVEVCGSGARSHDQAVSGRAFVCTSPVGRSTHVRSSPSHRLAAVLLASAALVGAAPARPPSRRRPHRPIPARRPRLARGRARRRTASSRSSSAGPDGSRTRPHDRRDPRPRRRRRGDDPRRRRPPTSTSRTNVADVRHRRRLRTATSASAGALAKTLLMAEVQGEDADVIRRHRPRGRPPRAPGDRRRRPRPLLRPDSRASATSPTASARRSRSWPSDRTPVASRAARSTTCSTSSAPAAASAGDYTTPRRVHAHDAVRPTGRRHRLRPDGTPRGAAPTCATPERSTDAVDLARRRAGVRRRLRRRERKQHATAPAWPPSPCGSLGEDDAADAGGRASSPTCSSSRGDDFGAHRLNAAGEASAGDGGQILERDGFRRATHAGRARPRPAHLRARSARRAGRSGRLRSLRAPRPAGRSSRRAVASASIVRRRSVTITGVGLRPRRDGATPRSTRRRSASGHGTADADGAVSMTVTIPADIEPGAAPGRRSWARPPATTVVGSTSRCGGGQDPRRAAGDRPRHRAARGRRRRPRCARVGAARGAARRRLRGEPSPAADGSRR